MKVLIKYQRLRLVCEKVIIEFADWLKIPGLKARFPTEFMSSLSFYGVI
jgi:hypothetical protein